MKILYRNSIKGIALALFSMLAFSACSDWTEVESIDLVEPNIQNQNSGLYAEYLENLREYKKSKHTLVYAWFDNSEKVPFTRAHHLTELPDSIDFVAMMHPDNLADWELEEMEQIRDNKATKVIYSIDFELIKAAYNAKLELATEEEPVAEDFIGFLTDSLEYSLSLAGKYNYDGICIGYAGKARIHMRPDELKEYIENETAFINIIRDWHQRNPQKVITYEGKPQNLIDTSLLDNCCAVLISGKNVTNINEFTYLLSLSKVEGVPADKFGMVVMATELDDPNKKIGYFTNGLLAMEGLAIWAPAEYDGVKVQAVGVYNVSTDYYTSSLNYYYTRQIISSVNPIVK